MGPRRFYQELWRFYNVASRVIHGGGVISKVEYMCPEEALPSHLMKRYKKALSVGTRRALVEVEGVPLTYVPRTLLP